MIRWNLLKCVLIILVMFHPLCIFAEKTLVVATSADPGHLNPGITTGYNVHVFAFVGLTSQAEVDLQAFEELVVAWPQVRECHMLMGETDFLLKIVAHDWDDFQKFLTSKLTPAKNVSHVKTALSIRSAKKLAGVPVDAEPASD